MDHLLEVRGSVFAKCVHLHPVVANSSGLTSISHRLAKRLGLTEFKDVFIMDIFAGSSPVLWKISVAPVVINCKWLNVKSVICYPIINCSEDDAFWEMVIGLDIWGAQAPQLLSGYASKIAQATPGPSHRSGMTFVGCNIRMATIHEVDLEKNCFYEYNCKASTALYRIAVNKVTREVVVIFQDNMKIYKYTQLPQDLEHTLDAADSYGRIMTDIRKRCPFTVINEFPVTVLVNFPTF